MFGNTVDIYSDNLSKQFDFNNEQSKSVQEKLNAEMLSIHQLNVLLLKIYKGAIFCIKRNDHISIVQVISEFKSNFVQIKMSMLT